MIKRYKLPTRAFTYASHHARALAWKGVKRWVQRRFPAVPTLSTTELAHWLNTGALDTGALDTGTPAAETTATETTAAETTDRPIVIDVRNPKEYAVSHLPGAYRAKTVGEVKAAGISQDVPVVVYCSVGYRSGRLGQALAAAGYSVMNLEGSIFQWANEGRSLVTTKGGQTLPTREVHPYSEIWGLLLDPAQSTRPDETT
ncbi:MAG: rhodanese-like domain-containing protein [Phormidesmis sp.]